MHHIETPSELIWIALGAFGGAVKVFSQWVQKTNRPDSSKEAGIQLFLNIMISGFSGYMGALIGSMITSDNQWHVVLAGVFGYLGVQGLDFLSQFIKEKFFTK